MNSKSNPQPRKKIDLDSLSPSKLLDDKDAASGLDVSPGTLSVWRSTGRYNLPYHKIGRKVRYRVSDLIAWRDSRQKFHTGQ
ncbi:MAG: helix-turn-helix domain-containing protein [Proteobacteria bacterium]|nr:helix-turn-helix domain-containing protein [Pseudomonadota bacterium]